MRNLVLIGALVALLAGVTATTASGEGVSPAQLQRAGWTCINPVANFPANPNVHCFPPGKLEALVAGTAETSILIVFATSDVNADEALLLGTERNIRADRFHNHPCQTAPPGGRPAAP